ncbi:hypothetical protein [Flavobacterium alkalisoli]|uniref:hypothetical protein n=1 Tax=Flavobacterium alkalisoli TaxID=2602769 RepID=UPI003A9000D4
MKKRLLGLTLITLLCLGKANAQETNGSKASVEESVTGIQAGPFGAWVNHEFKLTNQLTLRAEAGITTEYWYSGNYRGKSNIDDGWSYNPVITAETRWYYNLNSRIRKGKGIKKNSGNFLSLPISYHADWFFIDTNKQTSYSLDSNILSIVPTWGIRRTIGEHFDYETAIGLGYGYVFKKKEGIYTWGSDQGTVLNLHFRIGYHF